MSKPLQKIFYGQCKISNKKFFGVFLCTLHTRSIKILTSSSNKHIQAQQKNINARGERSKFMNDFEFQVMMALDQVAMTINNTLRSEFENETCQSIIENFNDIDEVYEYFANKYNIIFL
uniref:hypothetical protein n=1 Tax=Clostridium botulinum TaxID=1491 RepID=UPI00155DDB00|nr:hypothetical protein [Clostridium botulinum]